MNKQKYNFSIYSPGGNITALVTPFVTDTVLKKQINDCLMQMYPQVEQVGFVYSEKSMYRLEMAGGEFCGNATRTAAYYFLQGKNGRLTLRVSGSTQLLKAGIRKRNTAFTQMPIPENSSKIITQGVYTIVPLPGITQVVVNKSLVQDQLNEATITQIGYTILEKLQLLQTVPAAGVVFTTFRKKQILIEPVVWVRDIQTLFAETACASGTTAVAVMEALRTNTFVALPIVQPSGSTLMATIIYQKKQLANATIEGSIRLLFTGSITL